MKKILFIPLLLLNVFAFGQGNSDKIYLVDRTEIEGTIQKIDKSELMFMKIDDPDSLITVRLVTVWKIIYNNGFEEFFNDPLPEYLTKENEKNTRLGFINSKTKSDKASKEKNNNYRGANFLDKLSENQPWRALLEKEIIHSDGIIKEFNKKVGIEYKTQSVLSADTIPSKKDLGSSFSDKEAEKQSQDGGVPDTFDEAENEVRFGFFFVHTNDTYMEEPLSGGAFSVEIAKKVKRKSNSRVTKASVMGTSILKIQGHRHYFWNGNDNDLLTGSKSFHSLYFSKELQLDRIFDFGLGFGPSLCWSKVTGDSKNNSYANQSADYFYGGLLLRQYVQKFFRKGRNHKWNPHLRLSAEQYIISSGQLTGAVFFGIGI